MKETSGGEEGFARLFLGFSATTAKKITNCSGVFCDVDICPLNLDKPTRKFHVSHQASVTW